MTETIQRIVLASRPVGEPTLDNFRSEKLPIPHLGPNEMLLRTLWLSLDPYMCGRMSDAPSIWQRAHTGLRHPVCDGDGDDVPVVQSKKVAQKISAHDS